MCVDLRQSSCARLQLLQGSIFIIVLEWHEQRRLRWVRTLPRNGAPDRLLNRDRLLVAEFLANSSGRCDQMLLYSSRVQEMLRRLLPRQQDELSLPADRFSNLFGPLQLREALFLGDV